MKLFITSWSSRPEVGIRPANIATTGLTGIPWQRGAMRINGIESWHCTKDPAANSVPGSVCTMESCGGKVNGNLPMATTVAATAGISLNGPRVSPMTTEMAKTVQRLVQEWAINSTTWTVTESTGSSVNVRGAVRVTTKCPTQFRLCRSYRTRTSR